MSPVRQPWATETFGLGLHHIDGTERLTDLVSPGLRRNPRRAHLLVSTVLGKHVAVSPDTVIAAGRRLGAAVARLGLGEVDVLGMAETATSLGHCVADELDAAMYLHTTRRRAAPEAIYAEFQEGHSHATDHSLQPSDAGLFCQPRPLVIVDDEISTGKTALASIAALQRLRHRPRYVVASLVDVRSEAQREAATDAGRELNTRVDFVNLARGCVDLPPGLIEAVCVLDPPALNTAAGRTAGPPDRVTLDWPAHVPGGGRHGFLRSDRPEFDRAVELAVGRVRERLDPMRPVLVVGHEEFMYLPLRIADALSRSGFETRFQSTTRSPAYVHDDDGYPLRAGWTFPPSEPGETSARYLYNGWQPAIEARVQLVLALDEVAACGDLAVADVLSTAGNDVLIAQVLGPDNASLARLRRAQPA